MQTNDITFAGYAGRDAEDRKTGNGTRVVNFSLCHTEKGQGDRGDITTWLTVIVFGGWCDLASQIRKGNNVVVTGKLQIRDWKTNEGEKRQSVEVIARTVGILQKHERPSGTQASGKSSNQPSESW